MTTGISDDLSASVGLRIRPTFGYYRQKNGWITISPVTRLEQLKYIEEGWQYLAKYGAFDMGVYSASHPFEALFMFGGANEMPVEQVIQMGLYMDPPLVPTCRQHLTQFHRAHTEVCWRGATRVVFPQLESVPKERLGPFPCDFCTRHLPTLEARSQHQRVAHQEEKTNIQLGKTLGASISAALGQPQSAASPSEETLRSRIAELEANEAKNVQRRAALAKARAARRKKQQVTSPA